MNYLKNKEFNEMAISQEQKKNKILLINVLLICYMYIATIGNYLGLPTDFLALGEKRIYLICTILILGLIPIVTSRKIYFNGTILSGLFLTIYMIIMGVNYNEDPLSWFSCVAVWIMIITILYNLKSSSREKQLYYNILCISTIIISMLYIIGMTSWNVSKTVEGNNSIYYILTGMAFAFSTYNSKLEIITLLITSAAILISTKVICIIAMLIIWSSVIYRKGWSVVQVLKSIIGMVILAFFLWHIIKQFVVFNKFTDVFLSIFDKFNSGGSGRSEIYIGIIELLGKSSGSELLFGHGYNAIDRILYIGSHNDFLMVLYNYGLIGLGLYLIFFIQLIKDFVRLRQQDSPYAFAFGISLVIFLCISMTSNVLNTQIQFLLLCVFWGMVMPKREEITNAK